MISVAFDEKVWEAAAERVAIFLPHAVFAVVILLVFWLVARAAVAVVNRAGEAQKVTGDALFVLSRAVKISLLAVGAVTALGTLGVDITALVTSLGLTGLAVGFALKDIISNSLAGILILVYKPFHRQDRIMIPAVPLNLEGHVVHIDLRYTTLQLPDRKVLIPNANLLTNSIMVFQAPPPATEPGLPAPTATR